MQKPEYNAYRHTKARDISFHEPHGREIPEIIEYVKSYQRRMFWAFIIPAILIVGCFLILCITEVNFAALFPALIIAAICTVIAFAMRKTHEMPDGVAVGTVIGYGTMERVYIAVDEDRAIVDDMGRMRGERTIPDGAKVYILRYKTGFRICEAFEKGTF